MSDDQKRLVVAYLDDLKFIGMTDVLFNNRTMNPTAKFEGVSVEQSTNHSKSVKLILTAVKAVVGDEIDIAIGYSDVSLVIQTTHIYDTKRWTNLQVEAEKYGGYGKFWVMRKITNIN